MSCKLRLHSTEHQSQTLVPIYLLRFPMPDPSTRVVAEQWLKRLPEVGRTGQRDNLEAMR